MSDCSKAIRSAVGDDVISEAEATSILQRIENIARSRAAEKSIRVDEAVREIAGELRAGEDSLRLIDRRNRLLSLSAFKAKLEKVTKGDGLWANSLRRELELTWDRTKALERRFLSPFAARLQELGLTNDFRAQKHSKEFFLEAWNVGAGGTSPVVPGEIGKKIHELMKFYVDARKQRNAMLNMRGAYFREHENYGFMQSYSSERLRALGGKMDDGHKARSRAAFFDLVARVNIDPRTYEGRDAALFWSNTFDNIYADSHIEAPKQIDIDRFSGVHGSLANKISSSRLIWFADAESQWVWNNAIGTGDYAEVMMREMTNAAKSIALMTDWGPNWKNNVDNIADHLQRMAVDRADSAKQTDAFQSANLQTYVKIISGEADIPKRPTLAKWVRNFTSFLSTAKMGGVTIASIPDVVMVNNALAMNGMGAMERLGAQLNINTDKAVLEGLDVISHGFIGSLHNRFGIGQLSGGMARASHALFQLNFFNRWNDMNQEVTAKGLSWWLGKHSDVSFDNLPEGLREQLTRADIRASDWDAIRTTASEVGEKSEISPGAKKFVLMDRLDQITDDAVDAVAKDRGLNPTAANRKRVRHDIDLRLSTYFTQQIDNALNMPDLRTKYVTSFGGAQAGTFPRVAADLLMIFKSFPISVALRMKRRAEDAGLFAGAWGEKQWSFAWKQSQLIAWSAVAGYVAMTARDLLNGRTRRSLFDEEGKPNASVMVEAMAKGGGLGIMGDVLFGEYDRQYKSAMNTLAGPALGFVDPLASLYSEARTGALGGDVKGKVGSEVFNLASNNIPFANLFYVKPILNAFVFYNIREALSPGTLRRAERNVRDKNYQDFIIEPSSLADIPITEPGRKLQSILP